MPPLTADQIPAMIDSPQFAGLPPERRTDLLERALAEGAQSMAGQWDQPTFQKWGEFANRAREKVAGMETLGEKAAYVGNVLTRTGADMLKMTGAAAAGMSPFAAPRSGPDAGKIVPQMPGKTLLESAGANAAALATNVADAVLRDKAPVEQALGTLKQQIDQGAFFEHPKGFDGWLTDATGQVRDTAAKYYEDPSYAQQNDLLANPQNKELLQNYLLTRSPQAWEALTSNVLRTPGAATMQAERQAIQQDSPLGRSLGKQSSQYIGEATDPAELAGMAMGMGAGRAVVQGGQSLLRRGAALAGGVAGEVGSEQVSAFMDDPNMSWQQRQQIAKDSLIAGLGFAGVGAGAQALANRGQTSNVLPPSTAAAENPFAGPIQAPPQPTETGGVVEPPTPQQVPPGVVETAGEVSPPSVTEAPVKVEDSAPATEGAIAFSQIKSPHPLTGYLGNKKTMLDAGAYDGLIPQGAEYNRIIEAFAGSGMLGNRLAQGVKHATRTINDFDPLVVNFHRQVVADPVQVAGQVNQLLDGFESLRQGEKTREDWIALRDRVRQHWKTEVMNDQGSPEQVAARFFVRNNGVLGVMGKNQRVVAENLKTSEFRWNVREDLRRWVEAELSQHARALGQVEITHGDARSTLAQAGAGDLVTVDPPYVAETAGKSVADYAQGKDLTTITGAVQFIEQDVGAAVARGAHVLYTNYARPEIVQALQRIGLQTKFVERRSQRGSKLEVIGYNAASPRASAGRDAGFRVGSADRAGSDGVVSERGTGAVANAARRETVAGVVSGRAVEPVLQPGQSLAVENDDGSVDITVPMDMAGDISAAALDVSPTQTGFSQTDILPGNPALQDQPQTITGSNEQTGSAMPVPPPTAAAGAGAGEVTPTSTTATPRATAAQTAPAASGGGAVAGQTRSGGGGRGASGQAVEMMTPVQWVDATQSPGFQRLFREGGQINQEAILAPYRDAIHAAMLKGKPVSQEAMKHATGYGFPKGKIEKAAAKYRWSAQGDYRPSSSATSTAAALPANLQMPAVRGPLPSSYGGALPPATVKAWSGKLRTIHGIRQHLLRSIGLPAAGVGRFTKKALGIYQVKPETIRLQAINDVPVLAHEIGHAIHFRVLSDDPAKASDWGGSYDGELNALGAATSVPGYTADQIRKEGVAEFTRLWLTDGAKARASAPRFAAFFEQQLDERAPQMAKALRESRDMIEDYIAMPAFKKAEAQVVFDPAMEKPKSTVREWMRSGYTKWFNTLHPLEQVLKRVETVEPSLAAEAQRLAAYTDNHRGGWSSKAHADLFNHQTNLKGERVGESFAAILKDIQPGRAKTLSTYLALKRAAEIERSGKRSGFENARLPAAEMKALEAEFEGVRQRLMKWQQNELNLLVESGLLDTKTAAAMRDANRDYVPFYRLYERVNGVSFGPESSKNAGGYVDLNSGIKRLKGSDRAIIDPLQSMMKNAFMFRKIAEQNQIGHQFFDLIEQVQGHGQWGEGIKPKMTGKTITHAAVVEKLKEQGIIEDETDLPSDADLTLRLWEAVKRPDTANGEVIVFKNGQRKHYEVKDKLLMEALKTADADAIRLGKFLGPTMTKLATLPTRALRFGATGGPWFALPNFVRDQWIAGLQSKTGFLPFVDGIKGAFNVIAKTDAYQRWIEAGGKYHGLTTGTEAFNALLEDALPKDRSARSMLAELGKPRNWIKAIGEAGRILEEASRVQEFVRAERMGLSKMDAANASKAITLNFARAGERARVFNMLVPFLNAQLQQLDVLVNLHKDPKRRGQVISRGLMLITVPSVLTWWLGKDDEEIQNLPEWRKNLFWNLNLNPVAKALGMGEGFILSVPKPFLMGAIYGTSIERMLDYATGRDPNGARKALTAVVDQVISPLDMAMSLAGMRPVIEATANYDLYRGRDIIPQSMQDMPKPFQYDLSTSETAKLLGKWTGQSPMMIDHLIRGYFATAGQWGTGAIDWGMAKLGVADVPPAPAMSLMERPILNKFSGSPYAANAWLPRFYDAAHEMEGLLRVWTKQSQQMTSAEQAKWWKQHGQEILFYQRTINPQTGLTGAGDVRKAMERVSELGKAMKEVQANKVMSPELKRQRLIELSNQRNRIAEESYKAVFPKAVRERHY